MKQEHLPSKKNKKATAKEKERWVTPRIVKITLKDGTIPAPSEISMFYLES
ncbi:hypothetical protein [Emticicia sp. TH156]|uniref:hypothetical protein n=1 Tax=Emticicia sp. TH156 TaxID=2067454 RepID=UPI00130422F3|nr:hypothetical protein [Emticicia sp. TH156]